MRIAVLGAGLMGRCIARCIAESREVSEVLVADIDEERARNAVKGLGDGKLKASRVDVRDVQGTANVLRGFDVVINAVQYYFNLDVMRAAIMARVNYLDLGGLYHMTLKQLELDELVRSNGLTAIIGMGAQPGITNVLARYAVDKLDRVDSILIRDGSRDLTEGVPSFLVTWSLQTLLDELTMDAVIFVDGEYKTVPPLSLSEVVAFPEPVGTMETYVTLHSEVATFPRSFKDKGLRRTDWMEGSPAMPYLKFLVEIGFGSNEEVQFAGLKVRPREFLAYMLQSRGLVGYPAHLTPNDWEVTRVVISGEKHGRRVTITYDAIIPPKPEWRMSCAQYGVGAPAAIAAIMMGRGDVKARGVVPPENCIDPPTFFEELGKRNIRIIETVSGQIN